jgi:S-adenosylmethionine hydrolase
MRRPVVVLLTDFGTHDDSVALLRGVVMSIARDAVVVDLSHDVPPQDIAEGARLLADAPGFFPAGSVFVCVVDPGVGSARKSVAVRLRNGRFLVGPDNGLFTLAAQKWGVDEAREIQDPRFMLPGTSKTFHGRDVFAPAGAALAAGRPPFAEIGPLVSKLHTLDVPQPTVAGDTIEGVVIAVDGPFGNVWTNIAPTMLESIGAKKGDRLSVTFPSRTVEAPWVDTFADVPQNSPLVYASSRGAVALGVNTGDAAKSFGVKRGDAVRITRASAR